MGLLMVYLRCLSLQWQISRLLCCRLKLISRWFQAAAVNVTFIIELLLAELMLIDRGHTCITLKQLLNCALLPVDRATELVRVHAHGNRMRLPGML